MVDRDQLEALRRFDDVWHKLHDLFSGCVSLGRVIGEHEERHASLLRECRILYGRLSPIVGAPIIQWYGRQFDVFQHILGQPSLSAVFDQNAEELWLQLWGAGASVIAQATGRLEEEARQGKLALDAETVARWRPVILGLEAVRKGATTVLSRPLWLARLVVDKVEHSLAYRIIAVVVTIGGCIGLIIGVLALVGALG